MVLPFRTVGGSYSGAYYQQSPSASGISTALNKALADQANLFFLIWILPSTTPYQVDSQIQIQYTNAQIWGSGPGISGNAFGTVLQPVASPTYSDMIFWTGVSGSPSNPGSIDIKFLQIDGGNLTPAILTIGTSGGTTYQNTGSTPTLVNLTDPATQISGAGKPVKYSQASGGGPLGYGVNVRQVTCAFNQLSGSAKAGSIILGPGDSLSFTYSSSGGTGNPGTNLTLTGSILNSFINISATVGANADNTHPLNIHEVTFTSTAATTFALYIQGCQEACVGRVAINGSSGTGMEATNGASYMCFVSTGGSCWIENCNLAGLIVHGLVIKISGGNIGSNGLWMATYGATPDTTFVTVLLEQVHWDGPAMVPCIMYDNNHLNSSSVPAYGAIRIIGGSMGNGNNDVDGFISGQYPQGVWVTFLDADLHGGFTGTTPLFAVATGMAFGSIRNRNDGLTASNFLKNTSLDGCYTDNTNTENWSIQGQPASTLGFRSPVLVAETFQKAETGADSSLLNFTPLSAAARYRVSFDIDVKIASAAVIGWTASWKDSTGTSRTPGNMSLFEAGTGSPSLTFTTSGGQYHGAVEVDIDNSGTPIVVKLTMGTGTLTTSNASAQIWRLG